MTTLYSEFQNRVKKIKLLESAYSVLQWDMETYMPPNSDKSRGEQLALLSTLAHEHTVEPRVRELVNQLSQSSELTPEQAANVREIKIKLDKAAKISPELIIDLNKTMVDALTAWNQAKKAADYNIFKPYLEKLVILHKRRIEQTGYEGEPYNSLLEDYEPGITAAEVETLFAQLKVELPKILRQIQASGVKPRTDVLLRHFPVDRQEAFIRETIAEMGFDFSIGRLDRSAHPFCTSFHPTDARLTTRFDANNLRTAVGASFHEAGHGMYEQGLLIGNFGLPLGEAASYGIHESQSIFWERFVASHPGFWRHYFPRLQAAFPEALSDVSVDEFCFAWNRVEPDFIRVGADEVSYCLHVILRFELERDLFSGNIRFEDLPEIWNQKMQEYLGLTPPDAAKGILQDNHWAGCLIGYFPTYALGYMYAAQLREAAQEQIPDFDGLIERGQFAPIKQWLNQNIHRHGKMYKSKQLVERISGKPFTVMPFVNYLQEKYSRLYK